MWKQCDSLKGVAGSDEPPENDQLNLQPFGFTELQFIVYLPGSLSALS